jgi:uncharacterized membrane protein SpoIIM required for sporulation
MDLDQFLTRNAPAWARLDELLKQAGPNARRLNDADLDELILLYQRVSTHLSYATTNFNDPGLAMRLSRLVNQAGGVIYGTRPKTLRSLADFFGATLPAAIWQARWQMAVSASALLIPAVAFGVWLANSSTAVNASAPAALRQAYINHDFAAYYRSAPSAEFATHVYTNNVVVSMEAFGLGILLCLPVVLVLAFNGANLGVAAGLFIHAGQTAKFWGLVLPHGLLEITSVVIAGAAGIRIGWSIIDPGDRSRRSALAAEAGRSVVLLIGTVFTLAIAGGIEGFVTGSALATPYRVGLGITVELAFLVYVVVCGRRASASGRTGLMGEGRAAWARRLEPSYGLDVQVEVGQAGREPFRPVVHH